MIILGTTFSGKNIVALNFAIECTPEKFRQLVISMYWSVELISIILWSFYYQKLDKNWFPLQFVYFVGGVLTLIMAILMFPESPKFLYSKQKFEEARKSLSFIAWVNGKTPVEIKQDKEGKLIEHNGNIDKTNIYTEFFIFDTELETEE